MLCKFCCNVVKTTERSFPMGIENTVTNETKVDIFTFSEDSQAEQIRFYDTEIFCQNKGKQNF